MLNQFLCTKKVKLENCWKCKYSEDPKTRLRLSVLWDQIIVHICWHLSNLKKTYLGTLRQPIGNQTLAHICANVWMPTFVWLTQIEYCNNDSVCYSWICHHDMWKKQLMNSKRTEFLKPILISLSIYSSYLQNVLFVCLYFCSLTIPFITV